MKVFKEVNLGDKDMSSEKLYELCGAYLVQVNANKDEFLIALIAYKGQILLINHEGNISFDDIESLRSHCTYIADLTGKLKIEIVD